MQLVNLLKGYSVKLKKHSFLSSGLTKYIGVIESLKVDICANLLDDKYERN